MSDVAPAFKLAEKLVYPVILLMIMAAILFGSFSLILPPHQWTVWRTPVLIAAAGAVTLMIASASFSSMRPWVMDGLAAVLIITSAIPAIAVTLLLVYGVGLQIAAREGSWESVMYQFSHPIVLWQLLNSATIAAVPGIVGLWIARRRLRDAGRVSMAGTAARFSRLGLGLSMMIGAIVLAAAIYRRLMWP
jgi:intracellular septation protein A